SERFPWELTAAAAAPTTPGLPLQPVLSPTAATSQPSTADKTSPGPIRTNPSQDLLTLADVGQRISQAYLNTGSDDRGNWAEVRFSRNDKLIDDGLGPLQIVNRVYVAINVVAAEALYQYELSKQSTMPETTDAVGRV